MAVNSSTSESLAEARTAASLVGVSGATEEAKNQAFGTLAERLTNALVNELAAIKDAVPTVSDGGQASVVSKDSRGNDLLEQILGELEKMNIHLSLMTDEENLNVNP